LTGEATNRLAWPTGHGRRGVGPKRLRHAVRHQIEFQECSLDALLPEDHEARIVWD
jgi:hypothetical protein